jgi:hypothetical protein
VKLAGCSPPHQTHFGGELVVFVQSLDACFWSHSESVVLLLREIPLLETFMFTGIFD